MNAQSFTRAIDFTGLPTVNGADHNNLIDLTVPSNDAGDETKGKGLSLTTTDTASDTPSVPNAAATVLWKRFLWTRRPFAGETDKRIKIYGWNDDAINDAIFLKWVEINPNIEDIESIANNALATAQNAQSTATAAGTVANGASVVAAAAEADALAAVNTANAATVLANTGITNAAAAQTSANNALLPRALNTTISPSATPWQRVETDGSAGNAQWYGASRKWSIFAETQVKGTDAGASGVGKNTRVLNTDVMAGIGAGSYAGLNIVTGVITLVAAGFYKVRAFATHYDIANADTQHQLLLVKDSDNSTLLTGASGYTRGNATVMGATKDFVEGIINATAGFTIRLDHYISAARVTNGLGRAANIHPDAGGKEYYSCIEIEFLGA